MFVRFLPNYLLLGGSRCGSWIRRCHLDVGLQGYPCNDPGRIVVQDCYYALLSSLVSSHRYFSRAIIISDRQTRSGFPKLAPQSYHIVPDFG